VKTGRFEILKQKCAGADAVVYSARDPNTGDLVDLRVLTGLAENQVERAGFEKHVRLLGLVSHPSILAVHEHNLEGDSPSVAMDPAGDRSLASLGYTECGSSTNDRLMIVSRLAKGLAAAHRVSLFHGCISPLDVWMNQVPQLEFLNLDDGSVKRPLSSSGNVFIDPNATAVRSASSDVYSLGMVLHWLMVGQASPSVSSASGDELMIDWDAEEQVRAVSKDLRSLLSSMLATDELQRPNMQEVVMQLDSMITVLNDSICSATGEFDGGFGATMDSASTRDNSVTSEFSVPRNEKRPEQIGRFRIISELGRGGMGTVYRAVDQLDNQVVALKTLTPALAAKPSARRRFLKESRILGEVNNPYVTRLIDANEDNGIAFIALEFVDGESVGDYIKRVGKLGEKEALEIVCDTARGLLDAHQRGIIHRDIKPDNILLIKKPEGDETIAEAEVEVATAKLTDFGLARQIEQTESLEMTQAGAVLGTPFYMAPEQWDGGNADARSDVYSLGATLFHLLAGEPPFQAKDVRGLMNKHLSAAVPNLHKFNETIGDAVVSAIKRSMAKEPSERYQDAYEFLGDLERILRGEPTSIILHPHLPSQADEKQFLTWEFEWELDSPPHLLWPHISNTDRVNRAMGLPPAVFRTEEDPVLGTRRFAEAKIGAIKLAWEEHPFEWIEGRRFGVLREFSHGPFEWFISTTELTARGNGTLLNHSFKIQPRGMLGKLATKIQMGKPTRNKLEQVYRRIDRVAGSKIANSVQDLFQEAKKVKPAQRRRLDERANELLDAGADGAVVDVLTQFLLESPDPEVARIRPVEFARRFELDEKAVVNTCLLAVRHSVLTLLWDILCPICRVASDIQETLQALEKHSFCPACNLDFDVDFSESIELIFRVHPEIRKVETGTYCIGGPANFPHIVAQTRIRADERVQWGLSMEPGVYRLRSPQLPYLVEFRVDEKQGVGRWDIELGNNRPQPPEAMRAGEQIIQLSNRSQNEMLLRLERTVSRDDAITATQASSLALFRDLFPNQILAKGQLANVAKVTFLALSVPHLDQLYQSHGDSATFAVIHDCLRIADKVVREKGGAVVKMIGDGFLATFDDPVGAVQIGLSLPKLIIESEGSKGQAVEIAIHRGDAMLTTINDRLDYFGKNVNAVFDLLKIAEPGDLLITQSVTSDPGVAALLEENDEHCEIAQNCRIGPKEELVHRLNIVLDEPAS
jgi:serine/threonine protein kinase/class 3 adenylate cyclase